MDVTLLANDASAGCWWWWSVACVNPHCLFGATRLLPPTPIMVTTRYASQADGCTFLDVMIDGSAASRRFCETMAMKFEVSGASFSAWAIAWIYARRANNEFDAMAAELIRDAEKIGGRR